MCTGLAGCTRSDEKCRTLFVGQAAIKMEKFDVIKTRLTVDYDVYVTPRVLEGRANAYARYQEGREIYLYRDTRLI